MGKKMMKFYRICILFLLMSMSVFAANQWVYTQVNKDDLEKTNNNEEYWIGNSNNMIENISSLETGNLSLEEILISSIDYESSDFEERDGNKSFWDYDGGKNPIIKFEFYKNQSNIYNQTFTYKKNGSEKIHQDYKVPAPTTNFQEVESEINSFIYTKNSGNDYQYDSQEVLFRLYKGNEHNDIRPIKKMETNILIDNNYVDFVFEKVQPYQESNATTQIIENNGIIGKFLNGKFEITGLKNNESYNLDFYTLRYGSNNGKNYVVATYEDTIDFKGKNSMSTKFGEQYVYSEINKNDLVRSDEYNIDFANNNIDKLVEATSVKTNGIRLENYLYSPDKYEEIPFIKMKDDEYKYSGNEESMVKFKLIKNTGDLYEGKFKEDKINQKYNIPAPTTDFSIDGNTFSYYDSKDSGKSEYNYQEVLFRFYKGDKTEEIRPIKKIEDNFNNISGDNYMDFVFEKDKKENSIIIENKISGTLKEVKINGENQGKKRRWEFKLEGLEEIESYKVDFYTLRYKYNKNQRYVVVTYEGTFQFENNISKVTGITLKNNTLSNFLETVYILKEENNIPENTFNKEEIARYSGYKANIEESFTIPEMGSNAKIGDKIDLELTVEGKGLNEADVIKGIDIDGWSNPTITPDPENSNTEIKKFTVGWKNEKIKGDEIGSLKVSNNLSSQNITVLNIYNVDIEIDLNLNNGTLKDNLVSHSYLNNYNNNYNIDLEINNTTENDLIAGIGIFNYDKTKADIKEDGISYYGNPQNYHKRSPDENIFSGGVKGNSISVETEIDHSTDGEYNIQVFAMTETGKLTKDKNIRVRVDTVSPRIINIEIKKSPEILGDNYDFENYYYFDLSFEMEDFNASYKKSDENNKDGYSLYLSNESITILKSTLVEKRINYKIKVKKDSDTITLYAEDKAGNKKVEVIDITKPKDIEINTYEELYQKEKSNIIKDGYKFTKGGLGSNNSNPSIYVTIPSNSSEDEKVGKLKIEKINEDGKVEKEKYVSVSGGDEKKEIEVTYNFPEGTNIVRVTPISVSGVEGNAKEFKFVADTKVNTSYLNNEIIGSMMSDKNIEVDLSNIEELSGVEGYEYIFTVEGKISERVVENDLGGKTSTTISGNSISGIKIIDTSDFIEGAKGTLSFTVYDKLGNEKTFDKTYFIPTKPTGITSTIEGEARQRKSKVKIFGDTNDSKFSIENSIDGSNEE